MGGGNQEAMETQLELIPYTDRTFKTSGDAALFSGKQTEFENLAQVLEAMALNAEICP